MITITLQDGTPLVFKEKNGTSYISDTKVNENIFAGNMGVINISDDDTGETEELHNAELIQQVTYDGGSTWWLCFRELSQRELLDMEMRAKIDYIAMMTDVEV